MQNHATDNPASGNLQTNHPLQLTLAVPQRMQPLQVLSHRIEYNLPIDSDLEPTVFGAAIIIVLPALMLAGRLIAS